jgi:hypothetical protein
MVKEGSTSKLVEPLSYLEALEAAKKVIAAASRTSQAQPVTANVTATISEDGSPVYAEVPMLGVWLVDDRNNQRPSGILLTYSERCDGRNSDPAKYIFRDNGGNIVEAVDDIVDHTDWVYVRARHVPK